MVFNSVTGEYSQSYTEADWSYFGAGFMIMSDDAGLVFHDADHFTSGSGSLALVVAKD